MGLSPSSDLTFSRAAATRPKFVMTLGPGELSNPRRAATSEKESSSSVKCSETFMGCSSGTELRRCVRRSHIHQADLAAATVLPLVLPDHRSVERRSGDGFIAGAVIVG